MQKCLNSNENVVLHYLCLLWNEKYSIHSVINGCNYKKTRFDKEDLNTTHVHLASEEVDLTMSHKQSIGNLIWEVSF